MTAAAEAAEVAKIEASIVKRQPAIVAMGALGAVAVVGELLTARTHLVTGDEWTVLKSWLIPVVTALLFAAATWFIHRAVYPVVSFGVHLETELRNRLEKIGAVAVVAAPPTVIAPADPEQPPAGVPPPPVPATPPNDPPTSTVIS